MARMKPVQIHLTESDVSALDAESARTGASRAELIRRAVRAQYAAPKRPLSFVGVVSDGRFKAETIDEDLAEIFEDRWRRAHD